MGSDSETEAGDSGRNESIGYRAHYFEPVWGDRQENCIDFDLARVDDLPFEKNYYIKPHEDSGDLICWFVQGEEQRQDR